MAVYLRMYRYLKNKNFVLNSENLFDYCNLFINVLDNLGEHKKLFLYIGRHQITIQCIFLCKLLCNTFIFYTFISSKASRIIIVSISYDMKIFFFYPKKDFYYYIKSR